jgi:hypothetical protein
MHFMKKSLIEHLVADHDRIRSLFAQIKQNCDNGSNPHCLDTFRILKASIVAHCKGEEFALYSLFEQPKKLPQESLQHFTFEGYEEHDLVDFLMKEMGQAEEISLQWKAQLKVLSEMLEHHFKEEEESFFPQATRVLTPQELFDLAEVYIKERDQIFAKKTAARPNVTLATSARFN